MQPQGGFTIILTTTIFTPGWEEYEGLRVRRGSLENEKMEKQFLSWSRQQVKYPSNQLISCTLLCKEDTILSAQSYFPEEEKVPAPRKERKEEQPAAHMHALYRSCVRSHSHVGAASGEHRSCFSAPCIFVKAHEINESMSKLGPLLFQVRRHIESHSRHDS